MCQSPAPKHYTLAEYGRGEYVRFTPLSCPTGFTSVQLCLEEFWQLVTND